VLTDGAVVPASPTINAGTAGVQYMFAQLDDLDAWEKAVSSQGLIATYQDLFTFPFDLAIEPLLPPDLAQPLMQLPFEKGVIWSFTGGPHGGWGDNSGWAALDFAPPGEVSFCQVNEAWAVAVAPGLIVRSDHGIVVEDLDGDGLEQTGWTVLYLHVDSSERVKLGAMVKAGDHIGHPSCEGGVSNATHLHLARRYNGEWIPADGPLPFILDGWISKGTGKEYDGFLTQDGKSIEAADRRTAENQIER
jgi:murein DD-endopeptidase MepM/ murein hydrolase activator NlpD